MRRAAIAALGAAGLVGAVAAAPTGAQAAGVKYYTARPACAAAKTGHATCFAMRRITHYRKVSGAQPATALPAAVTAGPAGGYTPNDLAHAYGVDSTLATTQVVGIVDAYDDPNALKDLNKFDAQYGLPAETSSSFKKVAQNGSTTYPTANAGWAGEISLDLDAVRGLCHACKIILVEANNNSFDNLAASVNEAVKLGATIVTNSYGGAESGSPSSSQLAAYNHAGVVITASSADHGYYDWDTLNSGGAGSSEAPAFPASANTVVAVGGTTLQFNDDGTRSGESVWNENGPSDNSGYPQGSAMGASGGGCSTVINAQKWQSAVANYSYTACGSRRLSADVAALADPYTGYDIYDTYAPNGEASGWQTFGGTSLASPLIAAMWALAGGSGGVTYPALSLYGHFKTTATSSYFDVVTGGNGYCGGVARAECGAGFSAGSSPNNIGYGTIDCAWKPDSATPSVGTRACDAATGYDGPSGVGTPKGLSGFKALGPTAVITAPSSVKHGVSAAFNSSASTDPFPGGSITAWAWTFGDGGTSSSAAPSHTFASAGTYTVTLKVKDNYGRTGTVSKSVTVS